MTFAANLAASRHARASAWLAPPGQGIAIAAADFSDTTRYFDANGKLIPVPAYQKFSLGTYIEYGLNSELTLVARPFFNSDKQSTSPVPTRLATGGTDIGLRAGVLNFGDTVVSVQATAHVPFATHTPIVDFDQDSIFAGDFRVLVGHSFSFAGFDSFADLEGSYRVESEDEPDEWHADVTLGARRHNVLVLVQSFATLATRATLLSPRYNGIMQQPPQAAGGA